MAEGKVYFVSGIDIGIGKTIATGSLARAFMQKGKRVITQKLVQTGCEGISTDIQTHRRIQGIPLQEEDNAGLTCPYVFAYRAAPLLAATWEGRTIDPETITNSTQRLLFQYDYVLIEGTGGLMTPLMGNMLLIDYLKVQNYPVLLVTSGNYGSINHTLLSLYACKMYGVEVKALIYNLYSTSDAIVEANSLAYLRSRYPSIPLILLNKAEEGEEVKLPSIDMLLK